MPDVREFVSASQIPVTYDTIEICKDRTKLEFAGKDAQGRWQYHYSDEWKMQQELLKIKQLCTMDRRFWSTLHRDLATRLGPRTPWSKPKLLAIATHLLIQCRFRPHWNPTARTRTDDVHYGLTTMLKAHVSTATPATCSFEFCGKSGAQNQCKVEQKDNAEVFPFLTALKSNGSKSDPFLSYVDPATKQRVRITALELSTFMKPHGVHPKDFRTYHANIQMLRSLMAHPTPYQYSNPQRAMHVKEAVKHVARALNNTPSVAKKDYVFTGLFMLYQVDPVAFEELVLKEDTEITTTTTTTTTTTKDDAVVAEALFRIFRAFIDNVLDWRTMQTQYTASIKPTRQSETLRAFVMDTHALKKSLLEPTATNRIKHVLVVSPAPASTAQPHTSRMVKQHFPASHVHLVTFT
jgi:DNA topoisomerase IB